MDFLACCMQSAVKVIVPDGSTVSAITTDARASIVCTVIALAIAAAVHDLIFIEIHHRRGGLNHNAAAISVVDTAAACSMNQTWENSIGHIVALQLMGSP